MTAVPRDQTDAHEAFREGCVRRGDAKIAHGGEVASRSNRMAPDGRDRDNVQFVKDGGNRLDAVPIPIREFRLGQLPSSGKRSEEHTSELQSLMRTSYAVFSLQKKRDHTTKTDIECQYTNQNK